MQWRMATGEDFDRLNDMAAYSRLQDLVFYASGQGCLDSAGNRIPPVAIDRAIEARTQFIFNIW